MNYDRGTRCVQVAVQKQGKTIYEGFYDRQLNVQVVHDGGGGGGGEVGGGGGGGGEGGEGEGVVEDKQIIPDSSVLVYTVDPGSVSRIITVRVSTAGP